MANSNNNQSSMIPSIISGASSLLGSIGSMFSAAKAIKAQRQENELNRQFNAAEAQKSRDYNTHMFNLTNQYNDPSTVVGRLVKAGLNPALAFGGFANAQIAGSSAQASSNGSLSAVMPDYSGLSSAGAMAVNAYQQSRVTDAEVRLKEAQANNLEKQTSWIDKLSQSHIDKIYSDIGINTSNLKINEEQAKILVKTGKQIDANINLIRAQAYTVQQTGLLQSKEVEWFEVKNNTEIAKNVATIKQLLSAAHLNDEQAYRVGVMLAAELAFTKASTSAQEAIASNQNSQAFLHGQQTRSLRFTNDINDETLKKYKLEGLSEQQWKEVQSVIENNEADTDYKKAQVVATICEASTNTLSEVLDFANGKDRHGRRLKSPKPGTARFYPRPRQI